MPTYYVTKTCQTLHENEEKGDGGTRPKFYYVDPPLAVDANQTKSNLIFLIASCFDEKHNVWMALIICTK